MEKPKREHKQKTMNYLIASIFVLLGLLVSASLVFGAFETARRRQESVLGVSSADLNAIGLVDVTGPTYGADPNGVQDSTQAIQNAMNDSYWAEKAVFFPPGTYKITDTLWGVQESSNRRSRAHLFIGSTKGARPIIKLVNNASGFNNPDNPKAAVHFYAAMDDDNPDPEDDRPGNSYNQGIRGVDIEVGTGNSGAIGLRFNAAQDSILENVKVIMNSGFAGLYNLIGTNAVISNIEVVGGKYGIYTNKQGSQWPAISNLTLKNQSDYAIYDMQTVPVIAGFKIIKNSAPVIKVKDAAWAASYSGGSLSLIDGTIELSQTNDQPVIDNTEGRSVILKNVYLKNANTIIDSGNTSLPGGSGWRKVDEYASTIKKNSVDDGQQIGRTLINGAEGLDNIAPAAESVVEPPNNLMSTHTVSSTDYPSPDVILEAITNGTTINGLTVANVKDHGVQGAPTEAESRDRDGPDDTSSLQNVINNYDIVFLPKGKYLTTDTLTLKENTHLIGVTNYTSEIRPHEDWKPTSSSPGTVIRTVDSSSAKTKMSYMKVGYGSETNYDWFTAVEWRAGRNSVYKNVMVRPVLNSTLGGNPKADIKINGNGGGKFYGLDSHANGNRTNHPDHRRLLIENTHEPILMYGLNVEDGHGDWQLEIANSQNIAIYGYKSEDDQDLYIHDSENFILFGHGGSTEQKIVNTNNVYEGNLANKRWTRWGTTDQLDSIKVLTEVYSGQTNDFRADRIIALFKRGNADFEIFKLGDGDTPTPVPTSTPTPPPEGDVMVLTPDSTFGEGESDGDTYIDKDQPSSAYATNSFLKIDASPERHAFLKFDLSSLADKVIISSYLKLYSSIQLGSGSNGVQTIKEIDPDTWDTNITFNIFGSNPPTYLGTVGEISQIGLGDVAELDVTSIVENKIGQMVSFSIDSLSTDGLDLYSKNSDFTPELIVQYKDAVVPTPPSDNLILNPSFEVLE